MSDGAFVYHLTHDGHHPVQLAPIRTHAVRWVPWGCPAHGALPDTTECSRAQGRGQAPIRRGVRCKAVGGDASQSWGDRALVRRRGLSIAITQRVRCGRLVERSTERMSSTPIGRRPPTRCARSPARHPPRLRGSVAVRNALPRLAHGRSRLCHPGPARRRLRAAAPTAESGRVARSSGPQGPLHRRPRLCHGSRRRGDASAAPRPPQARTRTVGKVGQSAQPPADRSVQPRSRGRCAAGLPPRTAGLPGHVPAPHRLGNALEPLLRLASPRCPPRGQAEGTGAAALCPCG